MYVFLFVFAETPIFIVFSANNAKFEETQKKKNTICEHTCANCSCQNVLLCAFFIFGFFAISNFCQRCFLIGSQNSKNTKYESNKNQKQQEEEENKVQNKTKSKMMIQNKRRQQAEKEKRHLEPRSKPNKKIKKEPEREMKKQEGRKKENNKRETKKERGKKGGGPNKAKEKQRETQLNKQKMPSLGENWVFLLKSK